MSTDTYIHNNSAISTCKLFDNFVGATVGGIHIRQ